MRKFWQFIKSLFAKAGPLIDKYIVPSIQVLENIKTVLDNPVTDILTAIIPGNLDDSIKALLRTNIPVVLQDLNLTKNCVESATPEAMLQCALNEIAALTGDARNLMFHNIAVMLSKIISGNQFSTREAIHLVEETYQTKVKAA